MQIFRAMLVSAILAMAPLLSSIAYAEQKEVFDGPNGSDYEVHYIAYASTFIQPEIARQYELVRSKALGIINISVLEKNPEGQRKALGAVIEGSVINDIQQQRSLSFKQVIEGQSIYYLSQVQYREGEVLTFRISVYPPGVSEPLKLRFAQTFYND